MKGAPPLLPAGFRLHAFATVGSTNDEARALARAGALEGTLVWAERQMQGRGRRGRAWVSPPGNLYLSLVVRPQAVAPAQAAQLGFVAALGLGDALAPRVAATAELRCKWPNDLLLNGRKLAGILLESETRADGAVDFVVIGVGVNLVSQPEAVEYPATSLAAEGIPGVTPRQLLAPFARHFVSWLGRWRADGFAPVRAAWLARASGLGGPIRVRLEGAFLAGRFVDLDADGALLIEAAAGRRRIAAGDVFPAASG